MKYILGVSAFLILTLTGVKKGKELSRYVKIINSVVYFLNECKNKIRYGEDTVIKIISDTKSRLRLEFADKCNKYMEKYDFPEAWKMAVEELPAYICASDRELLFEFGRRVGTSDKVSQLNMIDYMINEFEISLSERKEKEKKEKRLYIFAGTAAGIFAFIMII